MVSKSRAGAKVPFKGPSESVSQPEGLYGRLFLRSLPSESRGWEPGGRGLLLTGQSPTFAGSGDPFHSHMRARGATEPCA